ncbi:aminodeoxychorismate synthase component 1 [Proteus myxofaciens]|uniref:Aminodeoxychorismate synthase component 1 n=1 Tax=Proteus myxofaciens ATCC 19692 TaxID=1354337 RepID=A0A198GM30_9GAMM|nr:aminodeoxychorismate synthase component 1 [Proteus myxofaciens]OAT37241.1 aminase component of para-aminobenzoate synthase [Proteus myxofaciens ATCC 19692]
MDKLLQQRELTYTPDLALRVFAPIASLPWSSLLHSGFAEHTHNRFDIIVADPLITLETRKQTTIIKEKNGTVKRSKKDPFLLIQTALDTVGFQPASNEDLPFLGGALGIWSYDLGRRIEELPSLAKNELNFADMAIGIYDWALIVDHKLEKATLISYQDIDARLQWLDEKSEIHSGDNFALTSDWLSNMNSDEYNEKIARIHQYLLSGDCYQVNLAQRFCANYTGSEWQAFLKLSQENKAPFSSFMCLPNNYVISISPERFIHLADNQISTRPIKGTLPRKENPEEDAQQAQLLADSQKDRAENLMIVDLMRNDIGKVAVTGSVKVPELFVVERFPAVHHLVSTITAELPTHLKATDLLRAAFPGGSITGAPKIRAMEIIEELEPHRRHGYCGAMGYISFCGTMDTNISIRTLLTEKNKIYCWAGGGIVADSVANKEYQETFDKLGKILTVLSESMINDKH